MRTSSMVRAVLLVTCMFVVAGVPPAQAAVQPMVAGGESHTVGLRSDGTVVAVGSNANGQCDVSQWARIAAVAANGRQTIGLTCDGTVRAVGYNATGACDVSGWSDITAIAAGYNHTVGLKSNGTVVATGDDTSGQCAVSSWSGIIAVAAGRAHTVGLKSDGTVVAVGANDAGQCNVSAWSDVVSVSAKGQHTLALRTGGIVLAAGYNVFGQTNVSSWSSVAAIAAGGYHSVGLKSNGTVVAVGMNGTAVSNWTGVAGVAAGANHTVAVKSDGSVVATGLNTSGQCNVSSWMLAVDTPAPATTLSTDSAPAPDADGWYAAPPWIRLVADAWATIGFKWDDADEFESYDLAEVANAGLGITVPGEGIHALHFRADDGCGNIEPTRTVVFRLDLTGPSTPLLALENLAAQTVRLDWSPGDDGDGSGLARYEVYTADGPSPVATTASTSIDLSGVEAGTRFRVRARDRAGNLSAHSAYAQVTLPALTVTPEGPGVRPGAVVIAFPGVWTTGATAVARTSLPAAAPQGLALLGDACFEITTTATFDRDAPTVTLAYEDPGLTPAQEDTVRLYHFDGAGWTDITSGVDAAANTVSGTTASFSPFAVLYRPAGEIVPTPASSARSLALTLAAALAATRLYRRRGGRGKKTGVEAL